MAECPKCGTQSDDEAVECPQCGLVFAKFQQRAAAATLSAAASARTANRPSAALRNPLVGVVRAGRIALLAGLFIWTIQFARSPMGLASASSILHMPNLVFHEAGHVIFSFFGRFITALGGSLLQFLIPVILAVAFLRQKNTFGAVVCTWWAGQNLLDLAPYIADARALELVLLGGKTGAEVEGHDWEFILTQLGWLHLDRALGLAAYRTGLVIMFGALAWGATYLVRHRESPVLTFPDDEA
jgi:hypothetical protein